MSGIVDSSGNALDTKEDGKKSGNENGQTGTLPEPKKEPVAEFRVEEGFFVVRIPVLNNVYQVLGHLAWAEDRIRNVYVEAQMRKQHALAKPSMLKNFANKWK